MYYIGTAIVTLYKSKHFFIFFSSFLHFSLCMFTIAGSSQSNEKEKGLNDFWKSNYTVALKAQQLIRRD